MKIALCLSGLARTFKKCYQSYIDNILSLYDCDVFVYVSKDVNSPDMDLIKSTKKVIVEKDPYLDEKDYCKYKMTRRHSCQGFLQQFWKIEECHKMMIQYQKEKGIKYDWVIRSRPDVQIVRKLDELNRLDNKYLYLPIQPYDLEKYRMRGQLDPNYVLPWQPHVKGLNTCVHDQFAIASVELMTVYAKRYSNMDELIARGKDMFAENLLARQLEYNNVQVKYLPVPIISSPIRG